MTKEAWDYDIASLETPTRDGYKFIGWHTEKEGGIPLVSEPTLEDNMTFYANWEKVESNKDIESPQTFDEFYSYIIMSIVSLTGLLMTLIYLKKRKKVSD